MIDGHNLIPKIPGLQLSDVEDEMQLIELLQQFSRASGRSVEVYFDNAPPGSAGRRRFGRVTAHFVRAGSTADSAIAGRLRSMKKSAANWTVVSSDRQVQAAARAARARVMRSEEFARRMAGAVQPGPPEEDEGPGDQAMGEQEIQEWLRLFKAQPPDDGGRGNS